MEQLDGYSTFSVLRGETVSAGRLMIALQDAVEDFEEWTMRWRGAEADVLRLTEKLS